MHKIAIPLILMMVAILVMVTPAAASRPEPVGIGLSIYPGYEDFTFPAEEPFNISHGWAFATPDDVPGSGIGFELMVDNVYLGADFVFRTLSTNPGDGAAIVWRWVHNFPDGMTGTHTFVGRWFASCSYAVKMGMYAGSCSAPNEKIVLTSNTVDVEFLPQSN